MCFFLKKLELYFSWCRDGEGSDPLKHNLFPQFPYPPSHIVGDEGEIPWRELFSQWRKEGLGIENLLENVFFGISSYV
jgi:hypothetical protein